MTEPTVIEKAYIGDGVYADFDGYHIVLTTEGGGNMSNRIYLDPQVLQGLDAYRERVLKALSAPTNDIEEDES